jgi:hypothetical protein
MPPLKDLPLVVGRAVPPPGPAARGDDNSNTQFAMLGLWVARRHHVPTARTLSLVWQRFRESQQADGSWGYNYQPQGGTPAMTCVGLIGLALGHGTAQELRAGELGPGESPAVAGQDPAIQKGLRALGPAVGKPTPGQPAPLANLYFLWSLERMAVLYNLKTVGGNDWYGWASAMLLDNQRPDGSWFSQNYVGSSPTIDTCLSLLILKRVNLAPDLTERLPMFLAIPESEGPKGELRKD